MRSYNKSSNDENIRVNNKAEASSSHARGALKDLTQLSENRKAVKTSKQKVQITKLSSSERFDKKQKLSREANKKVQNYLINSDDLLIKNHFERISGSNLPLDDVNIDIDVDEDYQDDDESHKLSDNHVLSNIKEVEQVGNISFDSSEDEVYGFQADRSDPDELEEVIERRRQLEQKEEEHEQEQNTEDQTEVTQGSQTHQAASTQRVPEDKYKPMEPKWNSAIFRELHYNLNKYSRTTLDVNDEDTYDVTMVAEYAPEIFNYMHELETKLAPDPYYMNNQDELKWEMRSVLIDWVVQVHSRFNLLPETLFLTVNYIDRFLSKRKVSLSRFQLVGAVALFIAAKYEEINCPTVQEVAYMADNAYSIDDFLKAERFMIDVLQFDMGWPGPMSFLRRTSKADDYDYETRTLAKYFLEITIMDARLVAAQPSWLAAGAHYLSRKLLNKGPWTELHVFYSGYTETQLKPLAEVLLTNCRNAESNHKAIFEKYQERRYKRSSTFVQEYFEAIENS